MIEIKSEPDRDWLTSVFLTAHHVRQLEGEWLVLIAKHIQNAKLLFNFRFTPVVTKKDLKS